ncbi:unknown [Clostridium sp. CAG:306]|nr:unknown [Clostridium sp. CAG:306]
MAAAAAVITLFAGITRFKNVIFSGWPLTTLVIIPSMAVTEVVFMPPPVPDGDAPIIIAKIKTNKAASGSFDTSTVLNPAVVEADIT